MKRNEKGFTLIELLIVVIILGILAVIGIPKFMNSKQEAIVRACQTNRSSLEDAGERFYFDTGKYPGTVANTCQGNLSSTTDLSGTFTGWKGPYIKANFTCPLDGKESYTFNATSGVVTCANVGSGSGKHAASISTTSSTSPSTSP
jgi:type II secretion system protein G